MERCSICESYLCEGLLLIPTEIELGIKDCPFCGTGQLINTPMKTNWMDVNRSFGTSPVLMKEKREQIKTFLYYVYGLNNNPKVFEVGGMDEFVDLGIKSKQGSCNNYDGFVCLYYLEHFPDPIDFLLSLYKSVNSGGYGLIQVPNYSHIKQTRNWLEYTQEHRLYFTEMGLTYLLIHCGFQIVKVNYYNDGLCLSVIVRKPSFENLDIMEEGMMLAEEKFEELIDKLPAPVVFYGAGHYAQLLLRIAKMKHGWVPARIFDSNESKVGMSINGIVVEGKENLLTGEDFNSIIVCCGMYNDEVCEMLKKSDIGNKEIIKWN
jgi:hypothetical protein